MNFMEDRNCPPHLCLPWTSFFYSTSHHQYLGNWWVRDRASLPWLWQIGPHMNCFKTCQRKYYLDLYFSFHYYCYHTTNQAVVSAVCWDCVCLYSYTSLAVICCPAGSSSRMRGLFGGCYRLADAHLRWIQQRKGLLKTGAIAGL